MRIPLGHLGFEADLDEELADDAANDRPRHDLVREERLGDRGPDPRAGVERCRRVLEHDLHGASVLAERATADAEDVAALEPDRAGRRRDQAHQRASDGGLAGAALADQAETVRPRRQAERHTSTACTRPKSTTRFSTSSSEVTATRPPRVI